MSGLLTTLSRVIILAVALLLLVWALFGMLDLPNRPFDGCHYTSGFVVTDVEKGEPADQAGLRVGDRILSMGGIPTADRSAVRRQPRAEIGERRAFVVQRTSESSGATTTRTIEVSYSGEPAGHLIGVIGGGFVGLVFLVCGTLVYVKAPSLPSLLFGIVGLGLGSVLLPEPYLHSYGLRVLTEALGLGAISVAFACLLHLLMVFPKAKRVVERKGIVHLIYLPAVLLAIVGTVSVTVQPAGVVETAILFLLLILLLPYFVLPILAMVHSYAKATREERAAQGLYYLLWGILIGLGPLAVELIAKLVAPEISLPGSDYYFLALVLIPVSFTAVLMLNGPRGEAILRHVTERREVRVSVAD
jgi:membrane-associated protease RseP (regulator of RpoE activity)